MRNIKELTLLELETELGAWGALRFYAKEILLWIYQKKSDDFLKMTNLPAALRERLKSNFYISRPHCVKSLRSQDGTEKFLLVLEDGNLIEAVAIPAKGRVTGCISSQVGCKFSCAFCASGMAGFKRNLTSAEMLDEVLYIKHRSGGSLTHLVFMGTGKPLDNYDNLMRAIRMINAAYGMRIGARRITVSTCGVIPGIERLSREKQQIELSISLHACVDSLRSKLVPINKKYPLKALIAACKEYSLKTNRQITFEYILIQGTNSDLQNALKLGTMIKSIPLAKVNLIPANCIKELRLEPCNTQEALLFRDQLKKSGINVTLRIPRGQDIEAACGQLRLGYENK